MRRKTKRGWLLLSLCYALVLLVWLGLCGGRLVRDGISRSNGQLVRRELAPKDFAVQAGVAFSDNWAADPWFASTDPDPQLHLLFEGGARVGRFVFAGQALNKPGGEMALYYTTRPGQGFSEKNKLPARQNADGDWFFDLGGRRVYALRLDPDSVSGVHWQVRGMVLNEDKPAFAYFAPDALQAMVLLFGPALLWAALVQLAAFCQPALAKRRLAHRWRTAGGRKSGGRQGGR